MACDVCVSRRTEPICFPTIRRTACAICSRMEPNDRNPLPEHPLLREAAVALDIDRVAYTRLSDLTTATDKAGRDAPAMAVCDV